MPSIAARTMCQTALELIGVASAEQSVPAVMAMRALQTLNTMLDAWSTKSSDVFTRPKIPLVLVPGRGTYTWGVSTPPADIPREPPVRLELALLTVDDTVPGLEWPLTILEQTEYEAGIYTKALESSYPTYVYLEQSQPVPCSTCGPCRPCPTRSNSCPGRSTAPTSPMRRCSLASRVPGRL